MSQSKNQLGEKLPPNVVALRRGATPAPSINDKSCFAAPTCALRQDTIDHAPEIVSAAYALITRAGEVVRGAQNVGRAIELEHLLRALDLLALEIHERYQETLQRELEESRARTARVRARRASAMPA